MKAERIRKWFRFAALVMAASLVASAAAIPAVGGAERIRKELAMMPFYSVFDHLYFQVEGGEVTLMGEVTRPTLRDEAERRVRGMEGVEKVVNRIEVLPLSPYDDRIRLAAYRALFAQPALGRYAAQAVPPIHIVVNGGRLALEGVVASQWDRNLAGILAAGVPGAFSVANNLRVETK